MAVTISDHWEVSYDFREYPSGQIKFMGWGSDDEQEIIAALIAFPLPMTMEVLSDPDPITYVTVPLKGIKLDHQGNGVWEGMAEYRYERGDDTEPAFTFDTTGGTAKITQSKQTINAYPAPGYGVPDFGGAIGVTKDSIEGTDIVIPTYRWSDTFFFPPDTVNNSFKAVLFAMTGRTNQASFRGFAAGEVLFEGVRGNRRGLGKWELSYHFAGSPNLTGITVGDITNIAKSGWEYLWCRYHEFDDPTGFMKVQRPVVVMIDRVYDAGDFSLLGIGA